MHLTLEADYAVRIVHCLSVNEAKRLDAKAISELTGVTLRFSLKILRKLVAGTILKSYKGTHGGYEIAKSPSKITLYDVIKTVEGTYQFSRCVSPDFACNHRDEKEEACKFSEIYQDISKVVQAKLEKVTFDQLM